MNKNIQDIIDQSTTVLILDQLHILTSKSLQKFLFLNVLEL
jgi:hypothetical protein